MGYWNKTCGISNLHIKTGSEVYVFPLEQNLGYGRCYSNEFWLPIFLPFLSIYNDYGGGEYNHKNMKYTLDGIRKHLVEMPLGDNEYHDIAVTKDILDEELFYEAVHEGRLKVKYEESSNEKLIDFVMIRKDIVDYICEHWENQIYIGNSEWKKYKFIDIINSIPVFVERLVENLNNDKIISVKDDIDYIVSLFKRNEYNLAFMYLIDFGSQRSSRLVDPNRIIVDLVAENKQDEANEIIVDAIRASFINCFLENSRRIWTPTSHEGKQTAEHKPYRILCDAINIALDNEGNLS
jgi:hypothetical protein